MALNLVPPAPVTDGIPVRRERILVYGTEGTGKSYAWQSILANTPEHVRFHVIDTDGAWEPAASSEEFAPHAHRVSHFEPYDWLDFKHATMTSMKAMKEKDNREDWFVVDLADKAWSSIQEFYQDRKFEGDTDSDDFAFAMIDGTLTNEDPMEKWGVINQLYSPFARALITAPGNVFVCTTAKALKKDNQGNYFRESRDNVRDYGGVGSRPGGQKNLGHDLATVLYLEGKAKGRRHMTRIKDRNREQAWGDDTSRPNENFVLSFLMGIAGWMPEAEA